MHAVTYAQKAFVAALNGAFLETEPKPENVLVTRGESGELVCRLDDRENCIAGIAKGTFRGDDNGGAVCITTLYHYESGGWSFPHSWHHFHGPIESQSKEKSP